MPKNYTEQEVQEAVERLVKTNPGVEYGSLGERKLGASFNELQDAAAGVFLLTPGAPFYVAYLGSKRTLDLALSVAATVTEMLDAVVSTDRRVKPVESLSSLANAKSALGALEGAGAARSGAFKDIEKVPAYQRLLLNTSRFLTEQAVNVRKDGAIVQTPQEARAALPGLVRSLKAAHAALVRKVTLLAASLDDFESMDLGQTLAAGVIKRSREQLDARLAELEPLTGEERLASVRSVVLDVLAIRASVKGFGSLTAPTTFVQMEGALSAYASTSEPANPATALAEAAAPYTILEDNDELTFTMEGTGPLTVSVPRSFVARIDGVQPEPFNITASNNMLALGTSFSSFIFGLAVDATTTIEELCTQINTALTGQNLQAKPYFNPERFNGVAGINNLDGTNCEVYFPLDDQVWSAYGVVVGDKILVQDDSSPLDGLLLLVDSLLGASLGCSRISGPALADEPAVAVVLGPGARYLRLYFKKDYEQAAVDQRAAIRVLAHTNSANITLGIFDNQVAVSRGTRAEDVALGVNTSYALQVSGKARAQASSELVLDPTPLLGRSVPSNPLQMVLLEARGRASWGAEDVMTGQVAVTFNEVTHGTLSSALVGSWLVLREADSEDDVGAAGEIVSVVGNVVTAEFWWGIVPSTDSLVEVIPDALPEQDTPVQVGEGPNQGEYYSQGNDSWPDLELDRPLPFYANTASTPYFFPVQASRYYVRFSSLDTSVSSSLVLGGTAKPTFFAAGGSAVGTSAWVSLPEKPKTVEVGDTLELYTTTYNAPASTHEVVGIDLTNSRIKLATPVSGPLPALKLSGQVPFARIRKQKKDGFVLLKTQLEAWLAQSVNQTKWFRELDALINPLTSNQNPTLIAVNEAKLHLQEMLSFLTIAGSQNAATTLEWALATYKAKGEPRVDTLLEAFRQRGADRAANVLLEGQYSLFFSLSHNSVSYLGDALEKIRIAQREHLPVRKTKRREFTEQQTLIGAYEDVDAEFDLSDVPPENEPDIPISFIELDGSAY